MTPAVSVVIPTFRRPGLVTRAVASALASQELPLEVLVLDDSPEHSAASEIAMIRDGRLRYVRRARPSGGLPAFVRNEGLALAEGEFVHFLDDDDELVPGALAGLVAALNAHPRAGVAVGIVEPVGADRAIVQREREYFVRGARNLRARRPRLSLVAAMLFGPTPFVNSACMIRRVVARAVGGYATDIPRCEDVDFYLRAIRQSGYVFVDRPVVRYNTGAESLMNTMTDDQLLHHSYKRIYANYRRRRGWPEFLALRALARIF